MAINLTTQTDTWVYLPTPFESHKNLDQIFDLAFKAGAKETSTYGPCIKFEDMEPQEAKDIVFRILDDLKIK